MSEQHDVHRLLFIYMETSGYDKQVYVFLAFHARGMTTVNVQFCSLLLFL